VVVTDVVDMYRFLPVTSRLVVVGTGANALAPGTVVKGTKMVIKRAKHAPFLLNIILLRVGGI
jgi:hypothetical protein